MPPPIATATADHLCFQQDWHAGAIRAAYDTGDDDWRLSAVFGMSFVTGFDDEILDALQSDHPEVQLEAVRAAGNFGVVAAWSHVHTLVRSRDKEKPLLLAATACIRRAPGVPAESDVRLNDLYDPAGPGAGFFGIVPGIEPGRREVLGAVERQFSVAPKLSGDVHQRFEVRVDLCGQVFLLG